MRSHPRWRILIQSCLDQEQNLGPVPRFMTLATVTADGNPAVRYVVFRGWHTPSSDDGAISLMTTSDTRSKKITELSRHPFAEICWYFQEPRQQFRITGPVSTISEGEPDEQLSKLRNDVWDDMSSSTREEFDCPPPGEKRDNDKADAKKPNPDSLSESPPLETYSLLLLKATGVDFLDLRENQRIFFKQDENGEWVETEVNP